MLPGLHLAGGNPFEGDSGLRNAWTVWAQSFSERTRGVYSDGLSWLCRWLEIPDPLDAVLHVASMTQADGMARLVAWETWLHEIRGNGPRTLKARRMAVLQAFRLLYAAGAATWIPQFPRRRAEAERPPEDALSMRAARSFVARIDGNEWRDARDRAVLWLVVGWGIPLVDVAALDVASFDQSSWRLHLPRRSAPVVALPEVADALRAWIAERPDAEGLRALFVGHRSGGAQRIRWTRLDVRGLWSIIRRRFDAAGFPKLRKGGFRHSAILAALGGEVQA
jgi:integrase